MITIAKLSSLPAGTRLRKCARILEEAAWQLRHELACDEAYVRAVCSLVANSVDTGAESPERYACIAMSEGRLAWREVADAALSLHACLGLERADWDFREASDGSLDAEVRDVMPFTVVLDRLRSPFNVGSVFRTADSFAVSSLLLVSPGAGATHPRTLRTARGCTRTVRWEELDEEQAVARLTGKDVFALELGGTAVSEFSFPREGVVIIGSEELGVSPRLLGIADHSLGRVSIPLFGSKGSLNVSVAFGILMHAWHTSVLSQT